jgi:hypothetical protein
MNPPDQSIKLELRRAAGFRRAAKVTASQEIAGSRLWWAAGIVLCLAALLARVVMHAPEPAMVDF